MPDLRRIKYHVWAYVEAVLDKGTENEKYIEDLVGPIKIGVAENLEQAMLELWAITSSELNRPSLDEIIETVDKIEQELADDKYDWVG